MDTFGLSNKNGTWQRWTGCAAASLLALVLSACGGGGDSGNTTAAAPAAPAVVVPAVAAPTGTAPVTLTAATPAATFAALTPAVPAVSVSIASPPKVTFSLTDGSGNAIIGFGSKSQSATATVAGYPNLAFGLAKLVPGTGSAPSRWVSYIVTTVPTYKSATDKTIVASVPSRPGTDNTGTLTDNGDGTYAYTFYRDITKVAEEVAAAAETATNNNADLDDLTYDPNLVHRLTIQISGNVPGTGTNTADGVQVTAGVPMKNPMNVIYDFIPATGKSVTDSGREIASTAKCNECHFKLGGVPGDASSSSGAAFHGSVRNDVRYCVVCHTEQRKYGRAEATTTATGYSGSTYRINGLAVGNLPTHIHKIHMGEMLTKADYNFANLVYNQVRFPQDIRNCTKCHDGTAGAANATAQGDNWKSVPSRKACGACHDGINFATGKGYTLADFLAGTTATSYGHVGGAKADDSQCALCHGATEIPVYHLAVKAPDSTNSLLSGGTNSNTNAGWIASNTDRLPAGAIKVTYDIQSVSRNASKQPVMVFRMLQNGTAVPFNTYSASGKTELWDNFMGSPSLYFVYAMTQDSIAAPADFNGSASVYLRSLWNGSATGTLTGPDTSGYYTATLTAVTIPDSAVMLTGGMGFTYNVKSTLPLTQTNLADYPVVAATGSGLTAGMPNKTGGLIVVAPIVTKVATNYTGRRVIVENARCLNCHQTLGVFTESQFHAAQRNDGTVCAWCHNPNRTSSGWSADSTSYIHAIHAGAKRSVKFNWHGTATDGFYNIKFPGVLRNCEACHVADGYDFSSTAASAALPNRLYRTVATGNSSAATVSTSPYVAQTAGTAYGSGYSVSSSTGAVTEAAATTLVNSPIATACFACHDTTVARQHMENNGASIYSPRSTALAKAEQCMFCHSSTSAFGLGIKSVHAIK